MCGILGIYNQNREAVSLSLLKRMSNKISHRGPDGEGYYIKGNIGLAHKRLAILDVSERGAQPMTSKNGVWTVVFNGCIYNFLELRQELAARGHEFHSQTDTEVISEGLAEFGPDYVKRFNGMFAIGAWNNHENKLYLFRDRYGVKPLYYWSNSDAFVFSSEIKGIIDHPKYSRDVNFNALNEYFTFQNVFSQETLFQGVKMVPAGTTFVISEGRDFKEEKWWDFDFSAPDNSLTFEESKEETARLFKQAVTRQMISDVPVGSYLSGGIDSASITAIASTKVKRLATFTCGFDLSQVTGVEANYDERRDAELIANYFKTEHYEQVINAGDLSWSLPRVVYHLEDLRVGMSYPNYYISRLASKFVKVCLQGTGGDELYGGYPWRYYRVFDSINKQEYFNQYYNFWQRLVPDNKKSSLFTENVKIDNLDRPRQIFEDVFNRNNKLKYSTPEEHIQNSLYFEIKTFLPGLLMVGDKLSMANGLEERFPFLDNDLVDFAQKIPVRHKLGDLEKMKNLDENDFRDKRNVYREYDDGKSVFRKSMGGLLPDKVINRKKQGFSSPEESWYRGENADYVIETLIKSKTVSSEFISEKFIKTIVDEHMNKKVNHRLLIWSLLNFEWWCKIYLDNQKFE